MTVATVEEVAWEDPVGIVEIAARLGVPRKTIDTWIYRGIFPQPKGTIGGRPAWDWPDVQRWSECTGYPHRQ